LREKLEFGDLETTAPKSSEDLSNMQYARIIRLSLISETYKLAIIILVGLVSVMVIAYITTLCILKKKILGRLESIDNNSEKAKLLQNSQKPKIKIEDIPDKKEEVNDKNFDSGSCKTFVTIAP